MNNNILAIAVHPDDETLGCGGTLFKHKHNGDKIHWLICTDIKVEDGFSIKDVNKREREIKTISELYDFDTVHRLGLSTIKVDQYSSSEVIAKISNVMNEVKPSTVYLPFMNDVHSDHRFIFNSAFSCLKTFRYPFIQRSYMMETLSETEFALNLNTHSFCPNTFIDITEFYKKKIDAIKIYKSEISEHPFPRSIDTIESLAKLRGSSCNCTYAESFMLIKEIK